MKTPTNNLDEHRKEASKKGHAEQGPKDSSLDDLSRDSKKVIDYLITKRLKRRTKGVLIRNSFVRSKDEESVPPLSKFSSTQGGAEVALKLYIAILWISAKKPYTTNIETIDWALMLDLPDPNRNGAARIRRAFTTLENHKLIKKEHVKGQKASKITPLKEDGSGDPYSLPKANKQEDQYFAVPKELWAHGRIQKMSTAALTMLLILLEEQRDKKDKPQWWTQDRFENLFHISKDVRAKGTKELKAKGLISTKFEYLRMGANVLAPRKTRKTYTVISDKF